MTYHLGPGPAQVHLKLEFDWKLEPALRRHRDAEGHASAPTSGSCAATTTTPG